MKIFMTRHADQAFAGEPLNQSHADRAERIAATLRCEGIRSVYTSPIWRCVATAVPFARTADSVITTWELTEGSLENQKYQMPELDRRIIDNNLDEITAAERQDDGSLMSNGVIIFRDTVLMMVGHYNLVHWARGLIAMLVKKYHFTTIGTSLPKQQFDYVDVWCINIDGPTRTITISHIDP